MYIRLNKPWILRDEKKGFFIAGTDTDVGKTLVAAAISAILIERGKKVCAIKPVASGCIVRNNKLRSHDALLLQPYNTAKSLPYAAINPFALQEPISPNLAAQKQGIALSVMKILDQSKDALASNADYIIIEGAGGWLTPISDKETMADLAIGYGYPVILVVGIRLGCINHALLTYQCMCNSGVKIRGWVSSIVDKEMIWASENISSIRARIDAPLLGVVPYVDQISPQIAARYLQLSME